VVEQARLRSCRSGKARPSALFAAMVSRSTARFSSTAKVWIDRNTKVAEKVGEEGEPSRTEVPLELLGDLAPPGLGWSYPLADEQWRCFAGHLPQAVKLKQAQYFFDVVKTGTKWMQPSGKWGPLPLKTAWMTAAPCDCKYRYGGAEVAPEPFPAWMMEILAVCMPLCGLPEKEQWPNSCNLNLYVDGTHSVGWHADDESLFQGAKKDGRIISLSLGQTRKFDLQCGEQPIHKMDLADGDLCTMEGLTQKHFKHRVPKENAKGFNGRINLTWRWVVAHHTTCGCAVGKKKRGALPGHEEDGEGLQRRAAGKRCNQTCLEGAPRLRGDRPGRAQSRPRFCARCRAAEWKCVATYLGGAPRGP
jgi:alkylated DNA repair dioxygenase AlkB